MADIENFEQLMEKAILKNKEMSNCTRSWRDKIFFIQKEWEINRKKIFQTKISSLSFQKDACCWCKTTFGIVYIRCETFMKILCPHCDSKFHSEFLFHDRKAVTPKSLLPLKAMELVQVTGVIIEKSKFPILQPT